MRRGMTVAIAAALLCAGLVACGGDDGSDGSAVDPQLVHLQRAQRRPAEGGRALLEALRRHVQDQLRVPAVAAPTSSASSSCAGSAPRTTSIDLHRPGRRLDRRVRQRRLARARAGRRPRRASPRTSSRASWRPRSSRTSSSTSRSGRTPSCSGTARTASTAARDLGRDDRQAEKIGPATGKIQVQGNRYEGLVVWANAMIESAGTSILSGPTEVKLERGADEARARRHGPARRRRGSRRRTSTPPTRTPRGSASRPATRPS